MKKLLVLGVLALSALSFANTTTKAVNPHANHQMNGVANKSGMMNGEMGSMMTPEMKKMMEEKGMMKDGKCLMMEEKMKGMDHSAHTAPVAPIKK